MRVFLISLASLLLVSGSAAAQTTSSAGSVPTGTPSKSTSFSVSGTAWDDTENTPIAYATAALFAADSTTLVAASVTDEKGKFSIPVKAAGNYVVQLSFAGYTAVRQSVALTDSAPKAQIGEVRLVPGLVAEAVTVTAPLVTTDIDKINYNPAADPETPVLTALEMMRKVPLLSVDGEENLEMRGQRNFKILVNGKSSTLMSRNYKDVLKSMPASSIKSIEVITDPPSKYDAEGVGGIINIITHRRTNNAFTGGINAGVDHRGGFNGSLNLAASLGKFSVSGNYFGGTFRQPKGEVSSYTENLNSDNARYNIGTGENKTTGNYNGLNLEASYEIDTFNLVSLAFGGYFGGYKNNTVGENEILDFNQMLTQHYINQGTNKGSYGNLSGNIDYQRTFMKPDRTFTVSYRIEYSPNDSKFDREIDGILNYDSYKQRSKNDAWSYEHTFQADYYDPLTSKHHIEAGLKYILRPNVSHPTDYRMDEGSSSWVEEPNRKNDMEYKQHIASAYGGYLFKLQKFSIKLGVRAEYTINDGTFSLNSGDYKLSNDYFDFIPYVTFGYQPKPTQNFRIGYTQRLSRPGIWYLNPYVNDLDPNNISTGNPNLKSEVSHAFNFNYGTYNPKYSLNVSLAANLTTNSIEQVSIAQDNGVILNTYGNVGRRQNYTLSVYGSTRLFNNKLSLYLNASGGYVHINSNNGSGLTNSGWRGNASLQASVTPWKNGNIFAGGGFQSAWISLQSKGANFYYYSIGVNQYFFDRKFNVGISANNPFHDKRTFTQESFGPGFTSRFDMVQYQRTFRINVGWRFGKMQTQVKKAKRGIQNDDVKAGGSSSGGSGAAAGTGAQ